MNVICSRIADLKFIIWNAKEKKKIFTVRYGQSTLSEYIVCKYSFLGLLYDKWLDGVFIGTWLL